MPIDMSPEQALELIERVRGPEGFASLRTALKQSIENRRATIMALQGEINGLAAAQRMVEVLEKHLGLAESPATVPDSAKSAPVEHIPATPPDIVARLKEHKCTFRSRRPPHGDGKWCERPLVTKEEKASGFCRVHAPLVAGSTGVSEESKDAAHTD